MLHYFVTIFDKSGTFIDAFDPVKIETDSVPLNFANPQIDSICERVFDVKNYIPTWLLQEDEEGKTLFVKFLQHYYDWYYCSQLSGLYSNSLFDFIDIESYDENVYETALNSFLPGITEIFSRYNYTPNLQNIINTLISIKLNVFQRKGTPQSVNILFSSLFSEIYSVGIENIQPTKVNVIYYFFPEITLEKEMLDEIYMEFLHPYGMTFTSESQQFNDTFVSGEDEDNLFREYNESILGSTTNSYEVPKIGNYIVYNMGDTQSLDYTTGCSSASPPPRGITANTANMPTYNHPNWAIGVSGATAFGDINIAEFILLPYEDNPNVSIPSC